VTENQRFLKLDKSRLREGRSTASNALPTALLFLADDLNQIARIGVVKLITDALIEHVGVDSA
jgi:hypothetical protein